ncbi:hypothetical protein TL16_g11312 [Triparma laevis f. inornata]|uniref:Kinesin light chain n=1 Tax=Triparma laevis f. inornata TaxID=1714386 RepID=A0A9W7ET43_9STRA|nr:hypothetical protein TL16_g11312 [Triparma laevis f. inornata]
MPEEKKVRGKKKKKQQKKKKDQRKLENFDACFALGKACNRVGDAVDSFLCLKKAKDVYEEQLGRDSEKAPKATYILTMISCSSDTELIEKMRGLMKRCERVLGEEHVVTLTTLDTLSAKLRDIGQFEEAKEVLERCLARQEKVLGEDHKNTLMTVGNLGKVYDDLKNSEKALEYYKKNLKGSEKIYGKDHPSTLATETNIAFIYHFGLEDYGKTEELYERSLLGCEAQFGKDHDRTKKCAENLNKCLEAKGSNSERLAELIVSYPECAKEKRMEKTLKKSLAGDLVFDDDEED